MLAHAFNRLEEGVIALLLAGMTLVSFIQVVARYVFNYSFTWALELVTFFFAWLIFLGISYGVKIGAHIGVDAAVKLLPPRPRRWVGAIATLLCMAYCVILFVGAWTYVEKMYVIGILAQDIPIPQWVPRTVVPLGLALTFIRFAEVLFHIVSGREAGLQLADEAAAALRMRTDEGAIDDGPTGAERR